MMRSLIENWPEGPAAGTAGAAAPRVDGIGEDPEEASSRGGFEPIGLGRIRARDVRVWRRRKTRKSGRLERRRIRARTIEIASRPSSAHPNAELCVHGCRRVVSRGVAFQYPFVYENASNIAAGILARGALQLDVDRPASVAGVSGVQRFPYSSSSSSASRASRDGPSTSASGGTSSASSPRAARRAVLAARRPRGANSSRSRI